MKTTHVRDLLESKGRDVWTVAPDVTVFEALEQMASRDVGALVVVEEGAVVGVFSERDYARQIILKERTSRSTPVRDIMSKRVLFVQPDQSVAECMALMTEKHNRHLPVLDGQRLVGIISIGDVVQSVISDQAFTIDQLERYISGRC